MGRIQAVILDLDDTLYPERQYVRSGYAAVCEHLRTVMGKDGPFEQFLWDRFCRGESAGAFDELSATYNLGLGGGDIGKLVEVYRTHQPDIQPYESIPDLLALLQGRFKLGLLSDGFLLGQQLKLEALELRRFFEEVVFTDQMGRDAWKPSPAGFERIAELLGEAHEACAYVADNPGKDFLAPNGLGWLTIQYRQPGQLHADKPAPQGGEPAAVASLPRRLYQALVARR